MALRINNKTFNKNIDQVNAGEIFVVSDKKDEYEIFDGFFMKLNCDRISDDKNAVKLNDGTLYNINQNIILQVVNAELVV